MAAETAFAVLWRAPATARSVVSVVVACEKRLVNCRVTNFISPLYVF
jgi:hypothetical protein